MKKLSFHHKQRIILQNFKKRKAGVRRSRHLKHISALLLLQGGSQLSYYKIINNRRDDLISKIYKNYSFRRGTETIHIDGSFGLECDNDFQRFVSSAKQLCAFNSRVLRIDLRDTTRIWPSGVTLLCSIKKWVELISNTRSIKEPIIGSNEPSLPEVEEYLRHCGFYDYVIQGNSRQHHGVYSNKDVVRISRIFDNNEREYNEDRIMSLLKNQTSYNTNQLGFFSNVILVELFSNVQEHGLPSASEKGWWVLAQNHPTHGFISLCIADNGIGIENSLTTGPQSDEISHEIASTYRDVTHSKYIIHATKENVSGATNATSKEPSYELFNTPFWKKHQLGNRRGNGLARVLKWCKELDITLTIISHKGACIFKPNGIIREESSPSLIMGGTMFHLSIPCNGGNSNV